MAAVDEDKLGNLTHLTHFLRCQERVFTEHHSRNQLSSRSLVPIYAMAREVKDAVSSRKQRDHHFLRRGTNPLFDLKFAAASQRPPDSLSFSASAGQFRKAAFGISYDKRGILQHGAHILEKFIGLELAQQSLFN